ncbi:MAG: hypothetical protein KDC57_11350 [Saprospiraceae bacterium]|nr:hypothetical protein [Saprospiraceae bacterium]
MNVSHRSWSLWAFLLACLWIWAVGFFYYPKWKKSRTEATISWDVSGYYYYLPAIFIYHDIKHLAWSDSIQQKYYPASTQYQAFDHPSGVKVMKYAAGMAVQYLPWFLIAHGIAHLTDYPADGFSPPYQFMLSFGSILMACFGLWFIRKLLLVYFSDQVVAWTLLILVFGTNYLNYSAIDGAMTHNYLFTIYALLLWFTDRWYRHPGWTSALGIGACIGLAALTRPTEIIALGIPLLWGLTDLRKIPERLTEWWNQRRYILGAGFIMAAFGAIQILYWKWVTGEFLVYSYQDQGFSWLHPHLANGLFSYKKGWLVYTPMMGFALGGFYFLWKRWRSLFWATLAFTAIYVYITFAWDIWWYGGSLGQRAMVQGYAVLCLPLAATITQLGQWSRVSRGLVIGLMILFTYYNLWLTHQAHKGGLLDPENMTKAYFWKVVGRYHLPEDYKKLMDTDEYYDGPRQDIKNLARYDFESDTAIHTCPLPPLDGVRSLCLDQEHPYSPEYQLDLLPGDASWIRISFKAMAPQKEWDLWKMTQLIVRFYRNDQKVKENFIRVHRFLNDQQTALLFMDVKVPRGDFNRMSFLFWNVNSDRRLLLDDVKVESFHAP